MAAAARAGISLTDRAGAAMVTFATGAGHDGGALPALDWDGLARGRGTLAFYMAVGALPAIAEALAAAGRDPREPALVVERCGLPDEQIVTGRLGDIAGRAERAGIRPPALLLVGPTVAAASAPTTVRHLAVTAAG
jgi:siroheme synthase